MIDYEKYQYLTRKGIYKFLFFLHSKVTKLKSQSVVDNFKIQYYS